MRLPTLDDINHRRDQCRGCRFATKHPERLDRPTKGLWAKSVCTADPRNRRIKYFTLNTNAECPIGQWGKIQGIEIPDLPPKPSAAQAAEAMDDAKAIWGRPLWDRFHGGLVAVALTADAINAFIASIINAIPGCGDCRNSFRKDVQENPAPIGDRAGLIAWGLARHNQVRESQGKAPFLMADTLKRYGDGSAPASPTPA